MKPVVEAGYVEVVTSALDGRTVVPNDRLLIHVGLGPDVLENIDFLAIGRIGRSDVRTLQPECRPLTRGIFKLDGRFDITIGRHISAIRVNLPRVNCSIWSRVRVNFQGAVVD